MNHETVTKYTMACAKIWSPHSSYPKPLCQYSFITPIMSLDYYRSPYTAQSWTSKSSINVFQLSIHKNQGSTKTNSACLTPLMHCAEDWGLELPQSRMPLTRSISDSGLVCGLVPVGSEQIDILNGCDTSKRLANVTFNTQLFNLRDSSERDSNPQATQLPIETKSQNERAWKRQGVIGDNVGRAANRLLADASK